MLATSHLAFIITWIFCGIVSTKYLQWCGEFKFFCSLAFSTVIVLCGLFHNDFFHIMTTAFRLHLCWGCSRAKTLISLFANHYLVDLTAWQEAPFCWRMKFSLLNCSMAVGNRFLSKILRYLWFHQHTQACRDFHLTCTP